MKKQGGQYFSKLWGLSQNCCGIILKTLDIFSQKPIEFTEAKKMLLTCLSKCEENTNKT